ncbi:MAG TPA: triose-phosphate isomerase [Actinobacteria bacterium]|nr:triose-phosphate isomerase [Actinomycetota bacterium]
MARKDLIVGNWKMNATHLEAIQMVQKLSYRLETDDFERVEVAVCPPFTALRSVQTVIETDHLPIRLGAQDVHWQESGAYTGAVSPGMLRSLGVRFVIVGHSERRAMFGDDDAAVARKTVAVLDAGMIPIVAVGESLEQREAGTTEEIITGQLTAALRGIAPERVATLVVAYEPIWAIGTGRTADPDIAGQATAQLRAALSATSGNEVAAAVRILYGGSVNPGNIAAFMAKRDIDGALVGGASLDPDQFAAIVRYWV